MSTNSAHHIDGHNPSARHLTQPSNIDWFRHASPYINAHRGKVFVIGFGGDALLDDCFDHLIHDIALLSHLGIRLVLVPGMRPQIDERLSKRQVRPRYSHGLRITDDASLPSVKEAAGSVRIEIEARLSMGLIGTPMSGARLRVCSGNFVTAKPHGIHAGIDYAHTGVVRRIDTESIHSALRQDQLVLLAPLGYASTGEVFNLRSEDVAMYVAIALHAEKLLYLLPAAAPCDAAGRLIRHLKPADCDALLHDDLATNAHIALCVQNGARACRHGVPRSHLLNYRQDGALLSELFTRDGCGSMISNDDYDGLRAARGKDLAGIWALIESLQARGMLAVRSREQLAHDLPHFSLIERDGAIIACAALYCFGAQAELACLATHPDYANSGRAQRLLAQLEAQASAQGCQQLFVLTTQTAHWFREQGFERGTWRQLPEQRQREYNHQRNSSVYIKDLPAPLVV